MEKKIKVIVISPDIFGMQIKIPMAENIDGLKKFIIKHKSMLFKTKLMSFYSLEDFQVAFNNDYISDQGLICFVNEDFIANHFNHAT